MPIQEHQRFDVGALEGYLRNYGFSGPLTVEQFKGGQSNPTYLIEAAGKHHVLRAKPGPAAKLLPSAHAVEREFRVITALRDAGIPVPRTYCLCEDESVIGRAFYVMEYVEGRVLWDQSLPHMTPSERAAIYDEMNRVIAALHRVDYAAAGLSDYGKPGNYLARQIGRWSRQYRASETERIEPMDALIAWLPENIPGESQYIASYCERTGRGEIEHWDFYLAYNLFRIAAILQGVMKRALEGTAASAQALEAGRRARPLADLGWKYAEKAMRPA